MIHKLMNWRSGVNVHSWRGSRNQRLLKVSIIVSPLHHFTFVFSALKDFTISPFHYVSIGVYYLRHLTIFVLPHLCTNPFHHLNFSPLFYNFTSKRRLKATLEQQAIELFGSCCLDEGDSEEGVGENNGSVEDMEEE